MELNASDARSKKALGSVLGDVTGSQVLSFDNMGKKKNKKLAPIQKRCIIMDEVDGMGAGDRSGMSELIQMIKKSKVPIVSDNGFDIVNDIMCLAILCMLLRLVKCLTYYLLLKSIHDSSFPSRKDLHLQRPFFPKDEIPRRILLGSTIPPPDEVSHCPSCRSDWQTRGDECGSQRSRGHGRKLRQRYPSSLE